MAQKSQKKGIMTPKNIMTPQWSQGPKIVLNIFEGLTLLNDRLVLPPQVQDKIK